MLLLHDNKTVPGIEMVESGERSEGGINKGEERARVRGVSLSPPTLPPHCFFFFFWSHLTI